MRSVLPDDLEAKRKLLIREYNKSVFLLAGGGYGAMIVCILLLLYLPVSIPAYQVKSLVYGILVVVLLPSEAYGIYRLVKQNDVRCRHVGFVCPHCKKPLYEPRGSIHLTGRCPKCGKGVTALSIRQDERARLMELKPTFEPSLAEEMHGVGTRIRFRSLIAVDQQNSPAFIYAEPGEAGEIQGYAAAASWYWVVAGERPATFLAWWDEFEAN